MEFLEGTRAGSSAASVELFPPSSEPRAGVCASLKRRGEFLSRGAWSITIIGSTIEISNVHKPIWITIKMYFGISVCGEADEEPTSEISRRE